MIQTLRTLSYLCLMAFTLIATMTTAAPIGDLQKIQQQGEQFYLETDQATQLIVTIIDEQTFRIEAHAPKIKAEAVNTKAPIVLPQVAKKIAATLVENADFYAINTTSYQLQINKSPLLFRLIDSQTQQIVWQEQQPLNLSATNSVQILQSDATEQFYGGGQQNGSFAFKGTILEISYSGGWEEGDRPSPAPFFMSNRGYGVLRNTWSNGSYDFRSEESSILSHQQGYFDSYYFVGDTIQQVLQAYTAVTGRAPLLPRWAFEYGDADCYNDGDNSKKPGTVPSNWRDGPTGTSIDVIDSVAKQYRLHDMPGGWILPNDGYGCGYTDLPTVVTGLAKYGFKTGLWTEDGVDKIAWEVGTAGSRAQKLDVAWTGQGYQFAMNANAAAAQGILENSNARPFLWTVMGWAGIQRYAVTWTGDQAGSWDYIRWHIPTLIGSGLSGQTYATGDVDGIFGGSAETFTRDLQWKTFTPVLMGMSGWSNSSRKHPWWFPEPYRSINRQYLKLKMRLMPYMYTLAYQAEQSGAPIVRGLMWDYPNLAKADSVKDQFLLGADILVAPVYRSMVASRGWRENIFLPPGQWHYYWDGRVVNSAEAGTEVDVQVDLATLPIFVRAGAILPMYPAALYDGEKAKDQITFDIYPHGRSEFSWYEDDGISRDYQTGAFSQQRIIVKAPKTGSGDIELSLGPVIGSYQGQLPQRRYEFWLHTRVKPQQIVQDGHPLAEAADANAYASRESGWYFDPTHYGILRIKIATQSIRQATTLRASFATDAAPAITAGFPKAPAMGDALPGDSLLVINRPAEEPGHPLENAFDDNPATWFRTVRDQSIKTGAHEFVLALDARRLVTGFAIAPRNDKHWQAGQAKDVEVYLADTNGEWGQPVFRGRLALKQQLQTIKFPPRPGSLLRFRILSTQDQAEDGVSQDPMVSAANSTARAFNALQARQVNPISISEFRILQQPEPKKAKQTLKLSAISAQMAATISAEHKIPQQQHKTDISAPTAQQRQFQLDQAFSGQPMRMNGLLFQHGVGVSGQTRLDYELRGDWQLLRADLGVDDSCKNTGSVQFQIFGDDQLLFDSGALQAPAVVKPELDIRTIRRLSLRTVGANTDTCANWANAQLIGFDGDSALLVQGK